MKTLRLISAIALMTTAFTSVAYAVPKVGIASVVEGEPIGTPPNAQERILRVGIDMNADEKVTTLANDRVHLVFIDGTSLTIGPNSHLTIDKFVYDPEKKKGDMALTMTRGSMRFVGGVISKSSEVTVKTPSASMGIRGGIFNMSVGANGQVTANFLYGVSFSITSGGVTQTTTQTGQQTVVQPGAPPPAFAPIPPGGLQNNPEMVVCMGEIRRQFDSTPALRFCLGQSRNGCRCAPFVREILHRAMTAR